MENTVRTDELYTIRDIEDLPEGERAELIDGEMYMMASPKRSHQRLLLGLEHRISDYIDRHNGSCEVNIAPFAVFLNDDEYTYVEPDILVVCDLEKLDEDGCHGAPDWIIEVVSPASVKMDYFLKLIKYRSAGVKEYWIVDPIKKQVVVYHLSEKENQESPDYYSFSDKVKAGLYEDLVIDFGTLT